MKSGRNRVLSRISVSMKTWDMMKKLTYTLAIPEPIFSVYIKKQKSKSAYESEVSI